jgi:hypothetical protein
VYGTPRACLNSTLQHPNVCFLPCPMSRCSEVTHEVYWFQPRKFFENPACTPNLTQNFQSKGIEALSTCSPRIWG